MNLFTQGQTDRMLALFQPGGFRAGIAGAPMVVRPLATDSCGCTDDTACNFDSNALNDDGTCDFQLLRVHQRLRLQLRSLSHLGRWQLCAPVNQAKSHLI